MKYQTNLFKLLESINKMEYSDYLDTQDWWEIRELVLRRDNHTCADCGDQAQCVHHETYDTVYTLDQAKDCISLCHNCHGIRHGKPSIKKNWTT